MTVLSDNVFGWPLEAMFTRGNEPMRKTPTDRAKEALVVLGQEISAQNRNRERIAEALLSVLSTTEIASRNDGRVTTLHNYIGPAGRQPAAWEALEIAVWTTATIGGHRPMEILRRTAEYVRKHFELELPLTPEETLRRALKERAHAA